MTRGTAGSSESIQPTLITARLLLRPFRRADSPAVQGLAGAWEIAATTLNVPHPYEEGVAEAWIETHAPRFASGQGAVFALTAQGDGELLGAMGLDIQPAHARAELGYWIAVPHWNRGYATEAGEAVLGFGFHELGLNRIHARHLIRNPASGRVLEKLGMRHEGMLRQHVRNWGVFEDLALYGLLAADWLAAGGEGPP